MLQCCINIDDEMLTLDADEYNDFLDDCTSFLKLIIKELKMLQL